MSLKIRKGDMVQIIAGADRKDSNGNPVQGKVLAVFPKEGKVIVEGYNLETKASRARPMKDGGQTPGGLVRREGKIHVSNVMLVDAKAGRTSRVGFRLDKDGNKQRFAKRSGNVLE